MKQFWGMEVIPEGVHKRILEKVLGGIPQEVFPGRIIGISEIMLERIFLSNPGENFWRKPGINPAETPEIISQGTFGVIPEKILKK